MYKCLLIASLLFPCIAQAHKPSLDECLEASQFISNATKSRDNGFPWERFEGQMIYDMIAIQQFEPTQRWFVMDVDDEKYLLGWAERAFNDKESPDQNATDFLNSCLERSQKP